MSSLGSSSWLRWARPLVLIGVVVACFGSVAVATASAKRIKLSGEVTGFKHLGNGGPIGCPNIELSQGNRKVGSFTAKQCGGLTHSIPYSLIGHIKVGAVKGYSEMSLNFEATGSFDHPGPATHGTGHIISLLHSGLTESVYVKGPDLPRTVHGRFSITLIS